jgi:hypothetical protein
VHVAIQHFDIGVGLDLAAQHLAGTSTRRRAMRMPSPHHLERHLLQVEDDVGGVFHHARDGAEFVRHAFDAHGGDGGAFNGAEQHAAQAGADGGSESALERLRGEHAVALGERFGIGD